MTTNNKETGLINKTDSSAGKAGDVKKIEKQNAPENRDKAHEHYKESEGAEARDSNEPYEDVITPESYDASVADKANMDQAGQAAR